MDIPHWPEEGEELDEYLDMEEPVSCTGCGRMVELNDCTFHTEYCDCMWPSGCSHGFCPRCCEELGND